MGWKEYLGGRGYDIDEQMRDQIGLWWSWYTATHDWYSSESVDANGRTFKVERISIKPARMVCQELASLLMNERTLIATDNQQVNDYIETFAAALVFRSQGLVERGFALGTGAWVNRLSGVAINSAGGVVPSSRARIITHQVDARHIAPISYDDETCTECAFVWKVRVSGKDCEQIQLHLLDDNGLYNIETVLLDAQGKQVELPGYATLFRTGSPVPQFSLVRPGLENTHADFSPFGVSVFDDALGAVQLVDEAVDSLHNDLYLGRKMLFLDPSMLEGADGNVTIPREQDQQLFRALERSSGDSGDPVDEYNPDLRVQENRTAINTALELLGSRVGFGSGYFSLEGASGLKTATEVVADHSELFRTVKKHENSLAPALAAIVEGRLELARTVVGVSIPEEYGDITVTFDDSVIEDTEALRSRDLREVAAGMMQPWEYRVKWYGDEEAKAKQMTSMLGIGDED